MPQLNHLHLHVSDLERSQAFYEEFFGFTEHGRHGPILFMRDRPDGMDLALAPAETVDTFPPWFHFGFRLNSADEVRNLFDKLDASQIVHPIEEHDDFVFFRCADPDGYEIEVYWE